VKVNTYFVLECISFYKERRRNQKSVWQERKPFVHLAMKPAEERASGISLDIMYFYFN
jgi:hypothetical protein